jgi:threonine aldolase
MATNPNELEQRIAALEQHTELVDRRMEAVAFAVRPTAGNQAGLQEILAPWEERVARERELAELHAHEEAVFGHVRERAPA